MGTPLLNIQNESKILTSFAVNHDSSQIAVSFTDHSIGLFKHNPKSNKFEHYTNLKRHIAKILDLDWAPYSNKIVSVSAMNV